MNTTREVVAPAMRAAAEELAGGQADVIFTADTRDLMGFFVTCQRLLREVCLIADTSQKLRVQLAGGTNNANDDQCGINDFTFSDLYKPTYPRLVKIFSYIINFIRFRESQTSIIDEHFNRSEQTKTRIEKLYAENQTLEDRVSELARTKPALDKTLRDKEARNEELKARLIELKRGQQSVLEKLERLKDEQRRLKAVLEERTTAELTVKQEVVKLRPYTQQSPAALETQLRELSSSLGADKAQIEALDRRARALQTSSDTFGVVGADVAACTKLLGDLQNDLAKEEEELAKAARHRDALSERSNNVRDVERQERLLQKQLGNVNARTEKLRRNAEEKAEAARVRMEELRAVHEKLGKERSEKGREMERRRVRIEQTEKKVYAAMLSAFRCIADFDP